MTPARPGPPPQNEKDDNPRARSAARRMLSFLILLSAFLAAFSLGCGWYLSNPAYSKDDMKKPDNFKNNRFVNAEPTTVMKPGTNWNSSCDKSGSKR